MFIIINNDGMKTNNIEVKNINNYRNINILIILTYQ